jgi:hypothetical protein
MSDDNRDRVHVTVNTTDGSWELITSRGQAEQFIEEWRTSPNDHIIELKGVADHRDANAVSAYIVREIVLGVLVMEVKL